MPLDLHYTDPRLVALYDAANPPGADAVFYRQLAEDLGATTLLDLGCGTGLMTRELVADDRRVIGVDPSPAMLEVARRNDPGNLVAWVEGDSRVLGTPEADLAIMTGNVPQVFLEDEAWHQTLADIHRALRPGGHLAF